MPWATIDWMSERVKFIAAFMRSEYFETRLAYAPLDSKFTHAAPTRTGASCITGPFAPTLPTSSRSRDWLICSRVMATRADQDFAGLGREFSFTLFSNGAQGSGSLD